MTACWIPNWARGAGLAAWLAAAVWGAPACGEVTIAIWGDSRENADDGAAHVADVLLNKVTDWDFQVHTGDFTHAGGDADWRRSLSYPGMDRLFVKGRFYMCTSNHDANRETWDRYAAPVLPRNRLTNTTYFYSVRKENVHLVFCDGYFTEPQVISAWLDRTLSNVSPDSWLIGVWHPPCYGDITYKSGYLDRCRAWLDKLYERGGDFVLHGHAHVYLRTRPLRPDGRVDRERGMVHLINGCGGASWKDPQPESPKTAFTPAERSFPCVTFLTLDGAEARLRTIDARPGRKLRVIDQWTWRRATAEQTGASP